MNKKLISRINSTDNNIDFIKLIAACLVIISHAFPIATGKENDIWINIFNVSLGSLSVDILFILSGILITKSLFKNDNVKNFITKKLLRIFPPLILVAFITSFVIGPIFTNKSVINYFSSLSPYLYFFKNSLLIVNHHIDGLFAGNVYLSSINGVFWTLPVQFICYLLCLIACKLKFFNQKKLLLISPLIISLIFLKPLLANISYILMSSINIGCMFYIGMLIYNFSDKIRLNKYIFILKIVLFLFFGFINLYDLGRVFCLPYIIVYLSYGLKPEFKNIKNIIGDISYPMYLWGFLIQQIIVYLLAGKMNPYINMLISLPVTFIIAYCEYKYFECKINKSSV